MRLSSSSAKFRNSCQFDLYTVKEQFGESIKDTADVTVQEVEVGHESVLVKRGKVSSKTSKPAEKKEIKNPGGTFDIKQIPLPRGSTGARLSIPEVMKDPRMRMPNPHHAESWNVDTAFEKNSEGKRTGYETEICPKEGWMMLRTLDRPKLGKLGSDVPMSDVLMFRTYPSLF